MAQRTILIVEDNALNRLFLKNILHEEYAVIEAENGKEAMDILRRMDSSFSAILLDLGMPVMDGYQVLEELRKSALLSQIPVIVTTGSDDEGAEMKALSLGATDYVMKPYKPDIILRRLENLVSLRESALLISALQRDRLTGLYNRDAFFSEAERLISMHPPGHYMLSAMDIEKFRLINSRYGSGKGDAVLRLVAATLEDMARRLGGLCCRITADNFAMLYPAELAAEELEQYSAASTVVDPSIPPLKFCVGRYIVEDIDLPVSDMYDRARLAQASIKGRYDRNVAEYDETMLKAELEAQWISEEMKSALENGQFEVWYQPQYNNFTGALIGAEALARWRHPMRGLISPGVFIPLFERSGFIYELDRNIWEQTCAFLRRCIDEGRKVLPISVNISRYDVFREDLVDVLTALPKKYSLSTELLRLEITESVFASDSERLVEVVSRLVDFGFTVEIDDFGSGFSSLNTLKDVPAQIIKLDMCFLEGKDNLERGGNIIESVVRMSRWLGLSVIAEGVETVEQASYLRSIGCHYSQGYYFSRPIPEEEYMQRLAASDIERQLTNMMSVVNLDNSAFWNPASMDTLIFNSYVGAACIFEYNKGKIELLRVSARHSQLFDDRNFTVEMALTLDWASFLSEEDALRVQEAIAHSIDRREDVTLELPLAKLPSGPQKTFMRFHLRVIATSGERCLVYATYENITRQHEAERLAYENAAQARAIMESMPIGVSVIYPSGNSSPQYLFRNDRYCTLLGGEGQGEGSLGLFDCALPEDKKLLLSECRSVIATGKPASVEYRIRRPDGNLRWLRSAISPVIYPGHEGVVLLASTSDITEQEKTQRELLDNLPSGAGVYELKDGQMSLLYQNKSYWDLVGLGSAAFPDPTAMSAIHPEDVPAVMRELGAAMEQRRSVSCDIRLRHLTEGYRRVHLAGNIVPQESGSFTIYVTYTPADPEAAVLQKKLPLLLRTIMASTDDCAFAKDKDFRYLCCSPSFLALAKADSEADIIGRTDFEIFPEETARQYHEHDMKLLSTGEPLTDIDETICAPNGVEHFFTVSKYILRDSSDEVVAIYGVGRDETAQRASLHRLKLLTDELPGGIAAFVLSPGSVELTYMNEGFGQLTGYSSEEFRQLLRRGIEPLVMPEELNALKTQFSALMRDGTPIRYVFRLLGRDGGDSKWVYLRAILSERHGERCYINALMTDVTERQEMMERLQASEEQFRVAADINGLVLGRYDIRTGIFHHSDKTLLSLGLPLEIRNVPQAFIDNGSVDPGSEKALIGLYEKICRGGASCRAEAKLRLLDGNFHWCSIDATIMHDADGKPTQAIIVTTDIDQRREKELIYQRWQASLENRPPEEYRLFRCNLSKGGVCDMTVGALFKDELIPDGETALDERSAQYARRSVHPNDRKVYLGLLDSGALLAAYYRGDRRKALEYRELPDNGGERWLRLSVELAEYPGSDEVGAYIMFEDIDLAKREELLIQQRAETDSLTGLLNRSTFEDRIKNRIAALKKGNLGALLIVDLDGFKQVNDCYGHAVGDETLIEIGIKLRDSFREQDLLCRLGGDEYLVYLQDVPHISAIKEKGALICALLHKSFSLDIQLSASVGIAVCPFDGDDFETLYRKADAALYQVKESGKDHYALYDESMDDKPVEKGDTRKPPEAELLRQAAPKRRMLIVEDNEINRDYLTNLFSDDFIVETAAEGTAALVRLKRYGAGISIVLLDLLMPGMDGFEVLRKMRENLITQSIPVIVVSALDEHENCLKAIREGASDFVTKPIDADLLRLRVSSALGKAENEQLRAQNRLLAIQNEETRRLTEARRHSEELSTALHAAERADIAKTHFLSSMSHEIRTPLNALIGYNAMAKGELSAAKHTAENGQACMRIMDCLAKTEIASRQLLNIINDVLDISAIEAGRMKVDDSPFDFKSLISSLTVMFFSQARAKGVNFDVIFEKPTEEWFRGDQMRVNQILTNLLSNAVKFTPEGGSVTLTVTEQSSDDSSAGFRFVVADTGIGMTEEYLTHIWTPFEQAEASIARRFGGSGLGLSITKNLVELMGGSISVESESGVGSTFTVGLCFKRTEQPVKHRGSDFSGINALVVDDDASTCDYIKLLFDRCGAGCMTFRSGRDATDAFAAAMYNGKPFNLCLVDWKMPGMDGFATIAELRRISPAKLPIVVVTGYDFSDIAEQAEKLGVGRFISKPLFQSTLFDLLVSISGGSAHNEQKHSDKHDFDGARVLLVEDNNMNMEVARHILGSANFAVDCAWNGQEAVDIFAAARPDTYAVVLMDVHMPEVDGYQATRMIRAMDRPDANRVPIIAMTADVFAEDIAEAHDAGMNGHIAKPVDVEALFLMLAEYAEDIKS